MLAVVAVLALVLYACSGSGSKKKQSAGDGKSSPTASQSSVPTAGGSQSAASGGASGGPSSANGSAPSGSAGGTSGSASASGGTNGGTNGASGGLNGGANTTGGTGPAGGSTSAPGCQLSLSLTSQSPAYANGVDPQFTVAVVNKGTADCDVDVSPKSLVLNVYSGPDHVWSSADCATGGKDLRGIAPGGVQTITFTWNRTRSSQGCTAGSSSAKLGMYFGVVSLGPGSGSNAPAAQSQPKSFELKTGS
ncbi:hypothetical protein ABH935_004654 [Catenulispora sp. GAS73]|uniref:hypothetical protein n=1 Tax=Catenulispora sp. GAS73 TaxID=3156269 RepID=UPI00351484AD